MNRIEHAPHTDAPSADEQEILRERGYLLDAEGRPLHPFISSHPEFPVGKGVFYHWGPNYTVDPIVLTNESHPRILLIQRGDTGALALPGGFIDEDEPCVAAALRELHEETGITPLTTVPQLVYTGPVDDYRTTRNAWPETTTLLWNGVAATDVRGGDDALMATWVPLRELHSVGALHGSHAALIEMAIEQFGTPLQRLEYYGDVTECLHPHGGHMGYDRVIATFPGGERVFIKTHDAAHFTDNERETHSRLYLQKEFAVYTALCGQYPHIPETVSLQDDTAPIMEAYDTRDGWHWHIPDDPRLAQRYITEIIAALAELESVAIPAFPTIAASYEAIISEGWGSLSDKHPSISQLLARHSSIWAKELNESLPDLAEEVLSTKAPPLDSFAHYDIRQSNIALHPTHGTRVIDWSWADAAPHGFDATCFLIDLAKSGYDVTLYREAFDRQTALILIGFWLARATEPNFHGTNVRESQLTSAITAYQLLSMFT